MQQGARAPYGSGVGGILAPALLGRVMLVFALMLASLWAMTEPAFASLSLQLFFGDGAGYSCNGSSAVGTLYSATDNCPTTLTTGNILQFFICNVEHITSNLMGNMFCGVVAEFRPAIIAAVTLAVVIFGVSFTVGIIPATAKDFQLFLFKMSILLMFALYADYVIGMGYNLLVTGMRTGILIAIGGLYEDAQNTQVVSPVHVYEKLDKFILYVLHLATDTLGVTSSAAAGATGTDANPCKNALFAVLGVMAVAFPPVFYMGIAIVFRVALSFFRAVFGYMYALILLMIFIALAPIFVSFGMFNATKPFFDKWMGLLVGMALQMVLVFTFLAFVWQINVKPVADGLSALVLPVETVSEDKNFRTPWSYCTLCDFEMLDVQGTPTTSFAAMSTMQCTKPQKPIVLSSALMPENSEATNTLFTFATTILLALLILAYIVDALLSSIPTLAQMLTVGLGSYVPQMMGGNNERGGVPELNMPGSGILNQAEQGFQRGFARGMNGTEAGAATSSGADGIVGGIKEGLKGASEGALSGAIEGTLGFLMNPQGSHRK